MTSKASGVRGLLTLVVYPAGLHIQPRPPDSVRAAAARVRAGVDALAESARQRQQLAGDGGPRDPGGGYLAPPSLRSGRGRERRAPDNRPCLSARVHHQAVHRGRVLRLAAEGRVDIDASITPYLPDVPTEAPGSMSSCESGITSAKSLVDHMRLPDVTTGS